MGSQEPPLPLDDELVLDELVVVLEVDEPLPPAPPPPDEDAPLLLDVEAVPLPEELPASEEAASGACEHPAAAAVTVRRSDSPG